ncbi:hypothetical protein Trydic_g5010 [Trypoxylus dichotomus]
MALLPAVRSTTHTKTYLNGFSVHPSAAQPTTCKRRRTKEERIETVFILLLKQWIEYVGSALEARGNKYPPQPASPSRTVAAKATRFRPNVTSRLGSRRSPSAARHATVYIHGRFDVAPGRRSIESSRMRIDSVQLACAVGLRPAFGCRSHDGLMKRITIV